MSFLMCIILDTIAKINDPQNQKSLVFISVSFTLRNKA